MSHTPASEDETGGQCHPKVGPNGRRAVSTRHASRVGSANIPSGLSGCCVLATFLLRLPAQSVSFLKDSLRFGGGQSLVRQGLGLDFQ